MKKLKYQLLLFFNVFVLVDVQMQDSLENHVLRPQEKQAFL